MLNDMKCEKMMSTEQTFLIKYGIHNFVTYAIAGGKHIFYIRKSERHAMITHAQRLIESWYGEAADIRVV